jgi:hypothetical protein
MDANEIRIAFNRLASHTQVIRTDLNGKEVDIHIKRPTFGQVMEGGELPELIARHACDSSGVPLFEDVADVYELCPAELGVRIATVVREMYEAATNPQTPSGGSSPLLGRLG